MCLLGRCSQCGPPNRAPRWQGRAPRPRTSQLGGRRAAGAAALSGRRGKRARSFVGARCATLWADWGGMAADSAPERASAGRPDRTPGSRFISAARAQRRVVEYGTVPQRRRGGDRAGRCATGESSACIIESAEVAACRGPCRAVAYCVRQHGAQFALSPWRDVARRIWRRWRCGGSGGR